MKMLEGIYKIALIFVFVFIISYIIRIFFIKLLQRFTKKTETRIDDIIINTLKIPSLFWIFVISFHISSKFSSLPEKYLFLIEKVYFSLIIISFTIFLANLTTRLIRFYLKEKNLPEANIGIIFIIINIIIYTTGLLFILSYFNISIAPLITTLGIGGLAVGLALKDTLANFFSGLYILMEKKIKVGDFIELEDGKKGYIVNINWRTITLKTLSNDSIVIPNEKLAQSIVINYASPIEIIRVGIKIPVSYDTDIDKFEKVVLEEVENFQDDNIVKEITPVLRFIPGFGDSALEFTLFVYAKNYEVSFSVESELRKRLFKRLKSEGIEIPYTKVDIYIKEGSL